MLAAVSAWRAVKAAGAHRRVALVVACLGCVFPLIAATVIRAKG